MTSSERRSLLSRKFPQIPASYNDQQPFLLGKSFRGIPEIRPTKIVKPLSLLFAVLCLVDLFGVFPIMSLPRPIIQCGIYGIPLILAIVGVQMYTAILLGRCWIIAEKLDPSIVNKNRYPYAAIADMTYGKCMRCLVTILLDLTIFGAGIPNLLVAAENLQLLGIQVSSGRVDISFCYLLVIIGLCLCPLMWLGSPKNTKGVAGVSVCTVTAASILLWYCIATVPYRGGEREQVPIKTTFPSWVEILTAYGIMAFQFDIHPMLLTIQVDMQNKNKIGKAVIYGASITLLMAAISTSLCAYKFGNNVPANILDAIPRSISSYIVNLLVTLQLCLSSAVGTNALFQHLESVLGISREFTAKRCMLRSFVIGLEVLIGEILPSFDVIMGLIGGTLTGPLIFILPPLFYSKICKLQRHHEWELKQRLLYERRPIYEDDLELSASIFGRQHQMTPIDDVIIVKVNFLMRIVRWVKRFAMLLYSDCILSMIVLGLGLTATVLSTYFNYFKVNQVWKLWSPCLTNISSTFGDL